MRHTDEELVFRCLDGDTEAFAVLVQRYQHAVYATAYHYAGRYGGAEDITQEAFWAAYAVCRRSGSGAFRRVERHHHSGCQLVAPNAPRLRNETPLPRRRALLAFSLDSEDRERDDGGDLYEAVHRAVDALPERYQLPVVLRYVQEMSYEEISRFTGESYDEIRGILSRACKMLRENLIQETMGPSQENEEQRESG